MSLNKTGKAAVCREPLTDTQLLMTITICIFFAMYAIAMLTLGGGFLRPQQVFDLLNDNAALIIVACGLTVVMIGGGIDISVGGVIGLTVMSCVMYLNNGGNIVTAALMAIGIGLAFGLLHGFLVSYLEIQPFIVTLAGMFFARGMTTRDVTAPTLMSMPPPIMTMVRPKDTMMRLALSFSMSKICCACRKPPCSAIMATRYITIKIPMVMVIRSCVSVRGSLILLSFFMILPLLS